MDPFRSVDGSNNNPDNPELGQVDSQLIRVSDADYGDGVSSLAGEGRPAARAISNSIFDQTENTGNSVNASDFLWMWGQFLDHDLSITANGLTAEDASMQVPTGDLMFDPLGTGESTISFTRSVFDPETGTGIDNPRQQINEITPFIDASNVYGSNQERMDALRGDNGKLIMSDGGLLGFNTQGLPNDPSTDASLFLAGDVRANENIGLTSLHTVFAREHNRLVDELAEKNPDWDSERLFQEAKKIVEAELQIISYNEFLPKLLGEGAIEAWSGYRVDVDPQIANEFSTAAYRLGHTLLSSTIMRTEEDGSESEFGHLQLRNAFFRPDRLITEGGVDDVVRGAATSQSEELDAKIIDDVRNFLFGPPGAGGFDLASLNIQRGRDHGLDDYNDVREAYGLERVESFDEITSDTELQTSLQELYGSVDNIDVYVGGLAEDPVDGSMLGELFHTIVVDQFVRTRDGDSYWHENRMTAEELDAVKDTTLADVIERNTDIEHMQDDVFSAFTRLAGNEGNNFLRADNENVLVLAGAGDDRVVGSDGTQQMQGDEGRDIMFGMSGDDIMYGGEGNDALFGQEDNDHLVGNAGDDFLAGAYGDDHLEGGDGNDSLFASRGNDLVEGGNGDDVIRGDRGEDVLNGGDGDDQITGGDGKDAFQFSLGSDVITDFNLSEDVLDFTAASTVNSRDDLVITFGQDGTTVADNDGNETLLKGVNAFDSVNITFDGTVEPMEPIEGLITGGPNSQLQGTDVDDIFGNTDGTQYFFGRDGNDTVIAGGNQESFTLTRFEATDIFIMTGPNGRDLLFDVETVRFDDVQIELDDVA